MYPENIKRDRRFIFWEDWRKISLFCLVLSIVLLFISQYQYLHFIENEAGQWQVIHLDEPAAWASLLHYIYIPMLVFGLIGITFYPVTILLRLLKKEREALHGITIQNGGAFLAWYAFTIMAFGFIFYPLLEFNSATNGAQILLHMIEPLLLIIVAVLFYRKQLKDMKFNFFQHPLIHLGLVLFLFLITFVVINQWIMSWVSEWLNLSLKSYRDEEIISTVIASQSISFWALILQIFSIGILTPIAEEILCRGIIHRAFAKRYGLWVGIITSSLFFTLIHIDIVAFLPIFLFGIILSLSYHWTGTLWAPITLHALNNIFVTVLIMIS